MEGIGVIETTLNIKKQHYKNISSNTGDIHAATEFPRMDLDDPHPKLHLFKAM